MAPDPVPAQPPTEVVWLTAFLDLPADTHDAGLAFWSGLLGAEPGPTRGDDGEFCTLEPAEGDAFVRAQRTDDGPRIHLDLHTADPAALADRAVELGADVVERFDSHVVLRSPAGVVLCAVGDDGRRTRPGPASLEGSPVLLDQLSVDVPAARHEAEVRFWETLTGWPSRPGGLPEFAFLHRPAGMPLRFLLQRTADPDDTPAGVHLDLSAGDDHAALAESLVARGAEIVARFDWWTVLRDPSGLEFCLTHRTPDPTNAGRD